MFGCVGMSISCMKRLKKVSEITDPCEKSSGKLLFVDDMPVWAV